MNGLVDTLIAGLLVVIMGLIAAERERRQHRDSK